MAAGNEYKLPLDMVILSTADLRGNILDYNEGFKEASGYQDAELVNKPHNMLRHPDMPKEAFKDFWQTIQAGRPWFGIVKNKRKNGDYYWVAANAAPVIENGRITRYLSVRYPATPQQKQDAQRLYDEIRAGRAKFPWTHVPSQNKALLEVGLPAALSASALVASLFTDGLVGYGLAALALAGVGYLGYRAAQKDQIPEVLQQGMEDIANGLYKQPIADNSNWGFGLNLIRSRVAEAAARNYDALRASEILSTAMNCASTNIMVADAEFNITSINQSLHDMFKRNETRLREALPNFKADTVVGSNMDIFHKDPQHQRKMVAKMTASWTGELQVAGLALRLTVVPISHEQERIGYVVEWLDHTEEAFVSRSIINAMTQMHDGEFDMRLKESDKKVEGTLAAMMHHVNVSMESMSQVVHAINEVVEAQAAGDLTKELPKGVFKGQIHDLKNAINYSMEKVKEVVAVAIEASNVVSGASEQVSQGAADLSNRVQAQAASLEKTSATMNQMASAIENTSEHARKAADLAHQVREQSTEGVTVMKDTIVAMAQLQESSNQIGEIVVLIDSIAFQTNLLALNAAVEAARAGEHGRGFAVVAGEVRALAQKSAEAAKDIKGLIDQSVSRVGQSTKMAEKSGEMLERITHSVEDVADMIEQIANSTHEQSIGISEVHQAVSEIDSVTQQNAALVEETTAAAETLDQEAHRLQQTMAYFKIDAKTTNKRPGAQQALVTNKPAAGAQKAALKAPPPKPRNSAKAEPSTPSKGDEWAEF